MSVKDGDLIRQLQSGLWEPQFEMILPSASATFWLLLLAEVWWGLTTSLTPSPLTQEAVSGPAESLTRTWRGCLWAGWWSGRSEGRIAAPAGCPSWAACTRWPGAGRRSRSTCTRGWESLCKGWNSSSRWTPAGRRDGGRSVRGG